MAVRKRFIALLLVTLPVAATLYAVFINVRAPSERPEDTVRTPSTADVFLRDVELTETDATGQSIFQLNATDVVYFNDRSVKMGGVVVQHMGGPDGVWTLQADAGFIPAASRDIHLTGNVDMTGDTIEGDPLQISTSELWVRSVKRIMETPAAVEIRSDDRQVRAVGMRTDWEAGALQLKQRVRAKYDVRALGNTP